MDTIYKDIRYAIRGLLKRPAFAAIAVLTLGLGIGANTAIFSVINAVLLRPLGYVEPARLITFRSNQSAPNLEDVIKANHTFTNIGGEVLAPLAYTAGAEPIQFQIGQVTGGYFETLGVKPARGRYINADDDKNGSPFVVVLTHDLWQRQFHGDPAILGKTLPLSGNVYTVIGVMPPGFKSPREENVEAWTPVRVSNPVAANFRGVNFLRAYGRLAPGVTLQQATADMRLIDQQLATQYPDYAKTRSTALIPLQERIVGESRNALLILFAAVSLVLLIACANFANLLMARSAERGREIVIRTALGAGRWRIIRQLLTESILISLAGGALGVLIAWWGTNLLLVLKPENLPRLDEITVDLRVFAFTLGVSMLTGLIFGFVPALTASRAAASDGLKEGMRSSSSRSQQRVRSAFVVGELAVALVLLVGAGLLVKTFWKLRHVEPGFRPDHLLTMRVELPEARYQDVASQTRFRTQALAAINTLPAVESSMISELPLSGDSLNHDFLIDGRPPIAPGDEPSLETRSVIGNYFHVMQIPLRNGRDFGPQDFDANAPLVGIANDALVRQYFPNEDPLGKRVRWARNPTVQWITIVGVVGDVNHFGLDLPEEPALYSPYTQINPWKRWMTFAVRTQSDPAALEQEVKKQIWQVDSQLPITRVQTMDEVASASFAARRFNMLLLTLFAGLALVLAAVGVYGVMSYAVTQRTHEIGIRMALGAQVGSVIKLIMKHGLLIAAIGVVIGLAGAFALTRLMTSLLFEVGATDKTIFITVPACLLLIALAACYIPARRAARVDPLEALRYE